jgi:hypothetical protein
VLCVVFPPRRLIYPGSYLLGQTVRRSCFSHMTYDLFILPNILLQLLEPDMVSLVALICLLLVLLTATRRAFGWREGHGVYSAAPEPD